MHSARMSLDRTGTKPNAESVRNYIKRSGTIVKLIKKDKKMKLYIDNPESTIVIEKCHGDSPGFILTQFREWDDELDSYHAIKSAIEKAEDPKKHKEYVERLLWLVMESLESWNSKHDHQRINIEVENQNE
jgi:hypothetical protein